MFAIIIHDIAVICIRVVDVGSDLVVVVCSTCVVLVVGYAGV